MHADTTPTTRAPLTINGGWLYQPLALQRRTGATVDFTVDVHTLDGAETALRDLVATGEATADEAEAMSAEITRRRACDATRIAESEAKRTAAAEDRRRTAAHDFASRGISPTLTVRAEGLKIIGWGELGSIRCGIPQQVVPDRRGTRDVSVVEYTDSDHYDLTEPVKVTPSPEAVDAWVTFLAALT